MGKAGRVACIFVPMALTIASFICAVLLQVAGWNTLDSYYFFQANLTDLSVDGSSSSNTVLSNAIGHIQTAGGIGEIYNIHLWNYCYSNQTDGSDKDCTDRESRFVFDPVAIWGLDTDDNSTATSTSSADNAVESTIATVRDNYDQYEEELLGSSGRKALSAYKHVAKWMFIAYQIAFWTNLLTIVVGLLAICSRWGSLLTWILSAVSTFFTVGSVLTSTILFSVVVGALGEVLEPHGIQLTLGRNALIVGWLGAVCSLGATFFWVFSICCCSGRSNPHHKSNKGGLWNAEAKGQGYNDFAVNKGRAGLKVEKTGGDYERVTSPYIGGHDNSDQVPLQPYSNQQVGYEPYRHS